MIPLSLTAREQYFELIQHYLEKEREEAVNRLIGALEDARRLIDAGYDNAVDHPPVYGGSSRRLRSMCVTTFSQAGRTSIFENADHTVGYDFIFAGWKHFHF
jgi:hypothetical protein